MSTKPSIAIVGAGHGGLLLALGLQSQGYPVTVYSDRTAADVAGGRISSTQFLFPTARSIELELGIDFWESSCPPIEDLRFAVGDSDGTLNFTWSVPFSAPCASVDYRVRLPHWMSTFARRGGRLVTLSVGLGDLDSISEAHDLTIVCTGKGEIGRIFEKDRTRSTYDLPQRALAAVYVQGLKPRETPECEISVIHDVGEVFVFPVLTTTGPADLFLFEGRIGGPLDCWSEIDTPAEYIAQTRTLVDKLMPWMSDRVGDIVPTDDRAVLRGSYAPTVRKPVATLPSGGKVLGMGDLVVLNDPITGEGANNAVKCARMYLDAITSHDSGPFDEAWMQQTFETYWDYVGWVTQYTNIALEGPPHVGKLIKAGLDSESIRRWHADSRSDPREFFPAWGDPAAADTFIAEHTTPVATG